jgi:hypothetical protein
MPRKRRRLDTSCARLTGTSRPAHIRNLLKQHIILHTPEDDVHYDQMDSTGAPASTPSALH